MKYSISSRLSPPPTPSFVAANKRLASTSGWKSISREIEPRSEKERGGGDIRCLKPQSSAVGVSSNSFGSIGLAATSALLGMTRGASFPLRNIELDTTRRKIRLKISNDAHPRIFHRSAGIPIRLLSYSGLLQMWLECACRFLLRDVRFCRRCLIIPKALPAC